MARTGRPKAELVLTTAEHEQLARWARRATSSQTLALRSKIVLACAEGADNKVVAERLGCEAHTVSKWRRRFVEDRLDGLSDERRPGRPRTISVDQVKDVIVATLESTPLNATHWTRSKMAERTGLSKTTIGKIWKDFGLAALESRAAELAAERHADGYLAPIALDSMESAAREVSLAAGAGDGRAAARANIRLHREIAVASGNEFLHEALTRVWDRIAVSTASNLTDQKWLKVVPSQHSAVTDAIRRGDRSGAGAAMTDHIRAAARQATSHQRAQPLRSDAVAH